MQQFVAIGNLTADPILSETKSGVSFCTFSIAVPRDYKNDNGERETDFFKITTWRNTADICGKFLKKGKKVAIVGVLQNRSYEDEKGVKHYVTDIIANKVEFLSATSNREEDEHTDKKQNKKKPTLTQVDDSEDQLPF